MGEKVIIRTALHFAIRLKVLTPRCPLSSRPPCSRKTRCAQLRKWLSSSNSTQPDLLKDTSQRGLSANPLHASFSYACDQCRPSTETRLGPVKTEMVCPSVLGRLSPALTQE